MTNAKFHFIFQIHTMNTTTPASNNKPIQLDPPLQYTVDDIQKGIVSMEEFFDQFRFVPCNQKIIKPIAAKICPECCESYFGLDRCDACLLLAGPRIECIICFFETAAFLTLPCKHKFHAKCFRSIQYKADAQNRIYRPCPLCRAKIGIDNTILEDLFLDF